MRFSFHTTRDLGPRAASDIAKILPRYDRTLAAEIPALIRTARRTVIRALYIGFTACFLASCSEVQMGYNVLSYDTAIADTSNQLLLLNAVRASQRYPRSFTSVGQIQAAPPISASLASTLTFSALAGLQGYNLNPSVQANGGYSQFSLGNLNAQSFMQAIRASIDPKITESFRKNPAWPRQLLELVYVQSFDPSEQIIRLIDSARKSKCGPSAAPQSYCGQVKKQIAEFSSQCGGSDHFIDIDSRLRDFRSDRGTYYNTAANYCHYARFRIVLEELTLAGLKPCGKPGPGCILAKERSALDMIGYLGELIAAQNYIEEPFLPHLLVGHSIDTTFDFVDVPLFVVRHGESLGGAAVAVRHDGENWYIPRPEFRSREEARSLQTLELVLQTVQAATTAGDLPKPVPSVAVIK